MRPRRGCKGHPSGGLSFSVVLLSIFALANPACSAEVIRQDNETSALTLKQIIDARREFKVEVLAFDTSKPYGSKFPYSDYVRLRITNNSSVTLPYLTPLTKRYSHGNQIGWSRAPVITIHDLGPKRSKTMDYYPHGHLSVVTVDKLTVEIEPVIDEEEARFFKELQP